MFFLESKIVIGGKYIFVLILILQYMAHCLNINFSLMQKITRNNVQNRRVLVKVLLKFKMAATIDLNIIFIWAQKFKY